MPKNKIHPDLEQDQKPHPVQPTKKKNIPRALREQVWLKYSGEEFSIKCPVRWCNNKINVFDFHVGHNKPEKDGGTLDISNLLPICSKCNLSMGSQYTIDEWNLIAINTKKCCVIS
jgi:hypothetical protein